MIPEGLAEHIWHILAIPAVIGAAAGIIGGLTWSDRRRARALGADAAVRTPAPRAARVRRGAPGLPAALATSPLAVASAGAGYIHAVGAPMHVGESLVGSALFLAAGLFQLVWAATVLRGRDPSILRAGVAANLVFVAAWLLSRTAGLPFVTDGSGPASVGLVDAAAVAVEGAIVVLCARGLRAPARAGGREERLPARRPVPVA